MNNFIFSLEKYTSPSSRYTCPSCGERHEFTRYVRIDSGEQVADHVGKCNRELHCGYHYSPKQYFSDKGEISGKTTKHPYNSPIIPQQKTDYLDVSILEKSMRYWYKNNFTRFLIEKYGDKIAQRLCENFFIGTSKHWESATAFWQVDIKGKIRQVKIIHYDHITCNRSKRDRNVPKFDYKSFSYVDDQNGGDKVYFAGKSILKNYKANLKQCFFGEYQISEYPGCTIGIVESEKTAVIASIYMPDIIWIATGGKNGCAWTRPEVFNVLKDREVILFPDLGVYDDWVKYAKKIQTELPCKIQVSTIIEEKATEEDRKNGLDLADYLLRSNENIDQQLKKWYYEQTALPDYKK